jgi:hypothetical protein
VQRIFRPVFDATDLKTDGSDFDHLFKDGEHFKIGELDAEVLYTPGHTPADITYKIEDAAFVRSPCAIVESRRSPFSGSQQKLESSRPPATLRICASFR